MVDDRIHGRRDVTHVRRMVVAKRRGDTDQNCVDFRDLREIGGGAETPTLRGLDLFTVDAMDIRLARVEPVRLGRIDIKAGNAETFLEKSRTSGSPT